MYNIKVIDKIDDNDYEKEMDNSFYIMHSYTHDDGCYDQSLYT